MRTFEIVFWISLFIVFYTYIGYGIVLYILVKIKETFRKPIHYPMPPDAELPELTLFIAAYNEEDVVDEKMLQMSCYDICMGHNKSFFSHMSQLTRKAGHNKNFFRICPS